MIRRMTLISKASRVTAIRADSSEWHLQAHTERPDWPLSLLSVGRHLPEQPSPSGSR